MLKKTILVATLAAAVFGTVGTALAADAGNETRWEQTHPRRDQVNDRLENQNRRIRQEVKEGELTHKQAAALHAQDRAIRREERAMASRHNGHITLAEQAKLNRQENRVSREIGK